jgi:predicted ATP-dependent endonuclease of OLD family
MSKRLSSLSSFIVEKKDREMYLSTVESEINHLKQLINPLPRIAFKLKTMILDDRLYKNSSILDSVVESAYKEFKDEITTKDILPLNVSVIDEDKIYVHDKRVDKIIEVSSVSSAIAAALQFLVVTYLFATPHESRVLVIEEPEESMSPIQQVVFMRYLGELIKYYKGINIILITTHSPYIAFATESRNYLAKYDHVKRLFTLLPSEVPRSFIYGDVLLVPR